MYRDNTAPPHLATRVIPQAHFRFPPGTPPGQYIVHYMWGGYRDCVDVDVLPDSKPVPQTKKGIYGYRPQGVKDAFLRDDHCQYSGGAYDLASEAGATCDGGVAQLDGAPMPAGKETCFAIPPLGKRNSKGQTTDEALAACQSKCSASRSLFSPNETTYNPFTIIDGYYKRGFCTALNVVPLTPPAKVAFPDDQNIPWGIGDCTKACFANEPEGSSICYGLRETSIRAVEAPWDIIQDDPRDEIFYSTCYPRALTQCLYSPLSICALVSL